VKILEKVLGGLLFFVSHCTCKIRCKIWMLNCTSLQVLKNRSSSLGLETFMAGRSSQQAAHELWRAAGSTALSNMTYKPSKLGQTGLVFGLWWKFMSGCVLVDYQSLRAAVMTLPPWLSHRHTDSFWPVILLAQPAELKT